MLACAVVTGASLLWALFRDPHAASTPRLALESGALTVAIYVSMWHMLGA